MYEADLRLQSTAIAKLLMRVEIMRKVTRELNLGSTSNFTPARTLLLVRQQ